MAKYHVLGVGDIKITRDISKKTLTHSLRLFASRTKKCSIEDIEKVSKGIVRTCGFCGSICRKYVFTFVKEGQQIQLTGIEYLDDLFYCHRLNKDCEGRKFNPNSVIFVSKTRNISENEALKFIKARNKSPFYKENHLDYESYRKFQAFLLKGSEEEKAEMIRKQNFSRSLEGYMEKHGKTQGEKLWKAIQMSKAITLEKMKFLYGDEGEAKFENWKKTSSCTLDNFIRRHGEKIGFEKHQSWLAKITRSYGGFGIKTTFNNIKFYSLLELRFYQQLMADGFIWEIEHDKQYPGTLKRSDFYFPAIDQHLEIAGMMSFDNYQKNMAWKIEKFNPIVVYTPDDNDYIIQDIIQRHKSLQKNKDN